MGPLFLERKTIFLGVVIVGLSFVIGVLVGYFGSGDSSNGHTQMLKSLVIDQVYSNILFTIILINIVWQKFN